MHRPSVHPFSLLILFLAAVMLASCGASTKQRSSSVMQYLYPNETGYIETPAVPRLTLPLRVGIAFVPETMSRNSPLTEKEKIELMRRVSTHFKQYDFVKSIELIPSAYLRKEGSFANLDQIKTMYGVDVIALISYDQTQFTDEGLASITYWTLIGAYVIPGEKNDTHTMVDISVYDIASRKMLFRAPGISHIKSRATPVNLSEQLRKDSITGFRQASDELVENLKIQLELFKEKVKESPGDYQIVHRPGYTGGGRLDRTFLLLLAFAVGCGAWRKKSNRA